MKKDFKTTRDIEKQEDRDIKKELERYWERQKID